MANLEALTVLAIIEAEDRASGILGGIFDSIARVADGFKAAGFAAQDAMKMVDEGLLVGTNATERLRYAESQLLDAQLAEIDAANALMEAQDKVTAAMLGQIQAAADTATANSHLADVSKLAADSEVAGLAAVAKAEEDLKAAQEARAAVGATTGKAARDAMYAEMVAEDNLANAEARFSQIRIAMSQQVADAINHVAFAQGYETIASNELKVAQAGVTTAQADGAIVADHLADSQRALAVAQEQVKANNEALRGALSTTASGMIGVGVATAMVSGYSVKLAGDFQAQTQVLVSGAGVSQNAIEGVRNTILQMSVSTGTSTKDLTDAYFQLNERLDSTKLSTEALSAATEVAKAHNADLKTVAAALADTMNAYGKSTMTATQVANTLGVAVERGGMSFQELASHLSTVLPLAASMHLKLSDVVAALATMTTQGMSTAQATNDLSHAIQHISGPTVTMLSTWNQLGLSQKNVADALAGPNGLRGALDLITNAAGKVDHGGQIVISTFKQSQDATGALTTMLNNMTPAARNLATEFQNGAIGQKEYTKAANAMGIQSGIQAQQFLALEKKSQGFNDALKAGKPGFANFDALLKSAYGDSTTLNTALLLGSQHSTQWAATAKDAANAGHAAHGSIQGWAATQQTLNFKLSQAKQAANAVAIQLGTALLPSVISILKAIMPYIQALATAIEHHQTLAKILVSVGIGLGVVGVGLKTTLGLFNLFKDSAAMFTGISEAIKGMSVIQSIGQMFGTAKTAIGLAALAVKEYEYGAKLAAVATQVWEGIQVAFDAVMDANPIVLIVVALIAVVGAIIYAYSHFKWFRDFVNEVWSGIKTGAKALADFFVGIWNSIVSMITSVWNGISSFFKKWWPLLLVIFALPLAILLALWNHFHTQITDAVKTVWGWIKDFLNLIWDGIKIAAQLAWDYIKISIIQPMQMVWNLLKAGWQLLEGLLKAGWSRISSAASWMWQQIKNYIVQPIQEGLNWLAGFGGMLWDHIVGAFNKVMGWLGNIGSWFLSVGSDIVNGIIKGIESGASALFSSLKNLASGALKAAKSFLGIGSPSKEFANQVGQWIPHGVAQGVEVHAHKAVEAVQNMAKLLPQAIGVNGALQIGVGGVAQAGTTFSGLGYSAASAGEGQVLNLNVDLRGAVVAGDRGMDDLVNKLGASIAQRVLPQAGVRFH